MSENERLKTLVMTKEEHFNTYKDAIEWLNQQIGDKSFSKGNTNGKQIVYILPEIY
jgi:hypothetical protein